MAQLDTFGTRVTSTFGGTESLAFSSLPRLEVASSASISHLPVSLKILLENLLRHEDGVAVKREDIDALVNWDPLSPPKREIAFMPARVLLQDFTGVPCVVDLAVMRDAIVRMGGDPSRINPLQPVDLVIDHSVQVDVFGTPAAYTLNTEFEYHRNVERYQFLRWGQQAFKNFRVVPPGTGIVHQINLEYLARVVFVREEEGQSSVYPDTLVGTDSHTTMINGLGVLGWGVGGIEAEAAMLGQPISMLIPQVVGFKLVGRLSPGTTATDVVLTVTQILRKKGVVGKFVEFFGDGLSELSLADRATIANMAPEYGATMGFFPVDKQTIEYLTFSGRSADHVRLVEAYCRHQGMFHEPGSPALSFTDVVELDLSSVEPSLAGPKRPQDRVSLSKARPSFRSALLDMLEAKGTKISKASVTRWLDEGGSTSTVDTAVPEDYSELTRSVEIGDNGNRFSIRHGDVVIAAITSCTNTSNPSVMVAAGLLARNAAARGLRSKPWVKTSLAPGSRVVTKYLVEAGLMEPLERLGFHVVGYGCTTCIGNSGSLPEHIAKAITENDLVVASVLSGNRNFEGRINPHARANYLASPPLVVAYAIAGTMNLDIHQEPLGTGSDGQPVYLKDIWPSAEEIASTMHRSVKSEMFTSEYENVFAGDERWRALSVPSGSRYSWADDSTYIKAAPYFDNMPPASGTLADIRGARVLALLGDSVTTDHISPAGSIPVKSPAGEYLLAHGIDPKDFNSYGARRGNHEVMVRGTFANIRLRNLLAPGTEGGWTIHPDSKDPMTIYQASMQYQSSGVPLMIIAGKEYGSGSSRDWAAKGPRLLGVKAVIAESFERIHRSNLVGMGILPLQFIGGETVHTLGLTGFEEFDIEGISGGLTAQMELHVRARSPLGLITKFTTLCRIDTPNEVEYYTHGGILQYVLRQLMSRSSS